MKKICPKLLKKMKHWQVDVGKTLGGRDKTIVFSSTKGKKRRVALSLSDDCVHILTERKTMTINLETGMTSRIRVAGKDKDKAMRLFAYDPGAKEVVFDVQNLLARHSLIRYMMEGDWVYGTVAAEANEEGFCSLGLYRITPGYYGGNDIGYGIHNATAFEDEIEFLADNDKFVDGDFITDIGSGRRYVCVQNGPRPEDLRYYLVGGASRATQARRFAFMMKTGVVPTPWVMPVDITDLVHRNLTRMYHIPPDRLQLTSRNISSLSADETMSSYSDYYTTGVTWELVEDEESGRSVVVGRERRH